MVEISSGILAFSERKYFSRVLSYLQLESQLMKLLKVVNKHMWWFPQALAGLTHIHVLGFVLSSLHRRAQS